MYSNMKERIFKKSMTAAVIGIVIAAFLASCGKKGESLEFKTAQEAVNACKKELSDIKKQKGNDLATVGKLASHWLTLQDSCYNVFLRDSTFDYDGEIACDFVAVSDSIRDKIIEKATSRPRTLQEVVKLKLATAQNRARLIESKDYKDVEKFYKGLDKNPTLKTLDRTIREYNAFLDAFLDAETISAKEDKLCNFIAKEDMYFRSLMAFLPEVTEKQLQEITDKTARVFDKIGNQQHIKSKDDVKIADRILLYLTIRFNRRIIQNAEACQRDVRSNIELTDMMTANYRWMLMQPLMGIDNMDMAAITEDQEKAMMSLAADLPMLLIYVDGKDFSSIPQDEAMKLTQLLSSFFLKSHLKSIL